MAYRVKPTGSPTGWRKLPFRTPVHPYHLHLGWLLGGRVCLATHTGRLSGMPRQVVLEASGRDKANRCRPLGLGLRDGLAVVPQHPARPAGHLADRPSPHPGLARPMSPEESGQTTMARYAMRHPHSARRLMGLRGIRADGSADDYYRVGYNFIPFVEVSPSRDSGTPWPDPGRGGRG